jgi:erythritol transport system ATP-binding protein
MNKKSLISKEFIIKAVNVSKFYGVTHALKNVTFKAEAGKVTVLFGENGAGKSTLMKILSGIELPSQGKIEILGKEVKLDSVNIASKNGIAIIHQELSLCPNLSIRDNIFMGREKKKFGFVDYQNEEEEVINVLKQLEETITPDTKVEDLRLGLQQIVEIARTLTTNAKILIMDEPTSALSTAEVRILFKVIRELKARNVAIIYISHHLEEALEISDHAYVLRDGELFAESEVSKIDLTWVVSNMLGHEIKENVKHESNSNLGQEIIKIENINILEKGTATTKLFAVENFSLSVRSGEIVSIFGLMGSGRTELMEALAGKDDIVSGKLFLDGHDITKLSIAQRIKMGLGLVPEDRQKDGLIQQMSVGSNLSLASFFKYLNIGLLNKNVEGKNISSAIKDVRVKTSGPKMPIESLSGGNQQKVVIGRMLLTNPKAILLDEPTRGIDVGAKSEIFNLLREQSQKGLAVLFVTSEISEAINWSDRIVVMSRGELVEIFENKKVERSEIMSAAEASVKKEVML